MRTKKILALILALLMLAGSLTACKSAYDNPNDYITLPDVGKIFITSQEMKDALDEEIESIREGAAGTVFEPLSDEDAVIEKGDQVLIDFDGTPDKEGLEDIASGRMGLANEIRSKRYNEMVEIATQYFKELDEGNSSKAAELKERLTEIEAEFSDEPAYVALIKTEYNAKMSKE